MAKGHGKSSATSATKKKHAKKHAGPVDEPIAKEKKPKGKDRGKKKEPKQKIYIAPIKPAPIQPDPLETTGLAHKLPADLLVVLRSFNKKAQPTKQRALEELQSAWVDKCQKEGEDSPLVYTLVEMLPVWLHHISALFIHPSRRIRALTASLHTSLLQISPVRDQILFFLRETATPSQLESILGTWCIAAHDVDRAVSVSALKAWKDAVGSTTQSHLLLDDGHRASLVAFVQKTALYPSEMYAHLNPAPPVPPPPPPSKNTSGKAAPTIPTWKDDGEQNSRTKGDEQEEDEQDRKSRLRVGALGVVRWILENIPSSSEDLKGLLLDPVLWTSLHHAEKCPWAAVEPFGWGQPNVRKAAWALVQTLLNTQKGHLKPVVPTLGPAILRSAWVEPDLAVQTTMWQPLLTFLKEFPNSWELELELTGIIDEEGESSSEDEREMDERSKPTKPTYASTIGRPSSAYREFLQFLELGCSGSPMQGYPTVIIILSSIPSSLIASYSSSPLPDLFKSFWAAIDSRALSSLRRSATSAAFLASLLECMVFLLKRLRSDESRDRVDAGIIPGSSSETVEGLGQSLVKQEFTRVWNELAVGKLKVEERAAARLLAQTLESLYDMNWGLFNSAWSALSEAMRHAEETNSSINLTFSLLKVFYNRFKDGTPLKFAVSELLVELSISSVDKCRKAFDSGVPKSGSSPFDVLVAALDQFREGLFFDIRFSEPSDNLLSEHTYKLFTLSPTLVLSYLLHRNDDKKSLGLWHCLLSEIALQGDLALESIPPLLAASRQGHLSTHLKPKFDELDGLSGALLVKALTGPSGSNELAIVRQLFLSSDHFLSEPGFLALLRSVVEAFTWQVDSVLRGDKKHDALSLLNFAPSLDLISAVFAQPPKMLPSLDEFDALLPSIFFFAYLLPLCHGVDDGAHPTFCVARDLWTQWINLSSVTQKERAVGVIKAQLKTFITDTQVRPLPEDILQLFSQNLPGVPAEIVAETFPSAAELNEMLATIPADAIDPSMGVIEPLIPPGFSRNKHISITGGTDKRGFSSYARIVDGLLRLFTQDRTHAKHNLWALRHFIVLSVYARDFQSVPAPVRPSSVFADTGALAGVGEVFGRVDQMTAYLLLSSNDEQWRIKTLNAFLSGMKEELVGLSSFLMDVICYAKEADGVRDTRVLSVVLDRILDDIDVEEADVWIQLARKLERLAPQTAMTITAAIAATATEPPKLDRYRNELAASLLGIRSDINGQGLLTLRKLAATAPDPDSEVVFLPQVRAVNVVKAFQQWVASDDEDVGEDVESAMIHVYIHLTPILQNLAGNHWEFIFDVLESVLENSQITDDEALVPLANALRLIIVLQDLTVTNKLLKADWNERSSVLLTMVRDIAQIRSDAAAASLPRSTCRELALSIVHKLPPSLIDHDTLAKMSHLITDSSVNVQKMAYQLLRVAARKRTEYLVIEAAAAAVTEAEREEETPVVQEIKAAGLIPAELLDIVQGEARHFVIDDDDDDELSLFGWMLGWMLIFDLFTDASFKIKSGYVEQHRNSDIIVTHFIPTLLGLLRLDEGLPKVFKCDPWSVDEFYIELYETGTPSITLRVLAAHLFYRALLCVPSLIHTWVLDCKDRQLTSCVTTYTSTYFSPVLIRAELAHVRSPEAQAELADENLSVKVSMALNEVVASYLVDEHQLEIKLKIPVDWPLHRIEVKDTKPKGVDEDRWRAWVLAVQQTIWAHNGRITDGLGLFKKNVTLHFEGQVECAICYSIISVMDGSLPKKPCKTCKNRFHAGCLYKWFNSSHSSSCPLCRSDII